MPFCWTRSRTVAESAKRAGWALDKPQDRGFEVTGMPNIKGTGYVDYVLWGDDGKPLAVVEAKKTTVDPAVGRQQAGWVKRALFLADRISLVNQAVGAFKAHLPEAGPVNLVTEKDTQGRVYVCTYPTMLHLIDQTDGGAARFGVGHFDLVIIDEAHRSVYQKYGAIFRYFDSLLVGLTATPREEVDKNTYELCELEPGVPTDAYELLTAFADGFLVRPRVQQVDLKFPRKGSTTTPSVRRKRSSGKAWTGG